MIWLCSDLVEKITENTCNILITLVLRAFLYIHRDFLELIFSLHTLHTQQYLYL